MSQHCFLQFGYWNGTSQCWRAVLGSILGLFDAFPAPFLLVIFFHFSPFLLFNFSFFLTCGSRKSVFICYFCYFFRHAAEIPVTTARNRPSNATWSYRQTPKPWPWPWDLVTNFRPLALRPLLVLKDVSRIPACSWTTIMSPVNLGASVENGTFVSRKENVAGRM